jgi:hypothetical protein
MATAHEDVASGGRRRGRRNLSWVTLFCFGGSRRERGQQEASAAEGTTTPWERSQRRRKKRTVPVDGDLVVVVGTAADSEVMRRGTGTGTDEESRKRKGLRLPGCCFLAPARAPGREVRKVKLGSTTLDRVRYGSCFVHTHVAVTNLGVFVFSFNNVHIFVALSHLVS